MWFSGFVGRIDAIFCSRKGTSIGDRQQVVEVRMLETSPTAAAATPPIPVVLLLLPTTGAGPNPVDEDIPSML